MRPARPLRLAHSAPAPSVSAAPAPASAPRRRVPGRRAGAGAGSASRSSTAPQLPPARDLVGPPCPLSNLRPVYYAPLFPSLHSPSGWGDIATPAAAANERTSLASEVPETQTAAGSPLPRKPHPYSLAEFPTASPPPPPTTRTSPGPQHQQQAQSRLARLDRVRRDLHARDLEWRWARYRFDAFNQAFWTRMNERFLRARDAYIARTAETEAGAAPAGGRDGEGRRHVVGWQQKDESDLGREVFPPRPSAAGRAHPEHPDRAPSRATTTTATSPGAGPGDEDVDLAPFYAEHLAATRRAYADYNRQLWRLQAALIWPAVKASRDNKMGKERRKREAAWAKK
ncbi:hypothetical protein JCM8202v2_001280 [Rhodotorula sphaerocarpa]